jgi:hypothetical protein
LAPDRRVIEATVDKAVLFLVAMPSEIGSRATVGAVLKSRDVTTRMGTSMAGKRRMMDSRVRLTAGRFGGFCGAFATTRTVVEC